VMRETGSSPVADEQILTDAGFHWRERAGVKVLVSTRLEAAGFANGFSTRVGGVSPFPENSLNLAGFDEDSSENIAENRRRFLNAFDGEFRLATAWQIHGDKIKLVANEFDIGNSDEKFDGLVSQLPNVLVGVKTADCVPVLLADTRTNAFAAVHAGWRGTAQSIVAKAYHPRLSLDCAQSYRDCQCSFVQSFRIRSNSAICACKISLDLYVFCLLIIPLNSEAERSHYAIL